MPKRAECAWFVGERGESISVNHRMGQIQRTAVDHQNTANFNTDARNNAATRGGHRVLVISQSFLDAQPKILLFT